MPNTRVEEHQASELNVEYLFHPTHVVPSFGDYEIILKKDDLMQGVINFLIQYYKKQRKMGSELVEKLGGF